MMGHQRGKSLFVLLFLLFVYTSAQCTFCNPYQFGKSTCEMGQFENSSAPFNKCCPCTEGFIGDGFSCSACPAGKQGTQDQYTGLGFCYNECLDCNAGYASSAGAAECYKCPIGKYSSSLGSSVCTECPAGRIVKRDFGFGIGINVPDLTSASVACTVCGTGTFSNTSFASACLNCPPAEGKFTYVPNGSNGKTVCSVCSSGKYYLYTAFPTDESSYCVSCPAGTFNPNSGGTNYTACADCTPGKFSNAGLSSCQSCSPGFYTAQNRSTFCDYCPAGSHIQNTGSSSCTKCPLGKYNPGNPSTICTDCEPGKFSFHSV
jgi:syndecan 4